MLKTLKIQNFKKFKELNFPQLKRVNLIAGKNNTGKTGVLEALLVLCSSDEIARSGLRDLTNALPNAFRNCRNIGNMAENYWKWLFHDRRTSDPVVISAETEEYANYSASLFFGALPAEYKWMVGVEGGIFFSVLPQTSKKTMATDPKPPLNMRVVALSVHPTDPQQDAVAYDQVVLKAGAEERLEALLRKIEPALKSVRSITPHGASLIYVGLAGLKERIPAVHLGQGFIRLLSIYSKLIASGAQVLLIDEVENGLHHSILIDIWRGLSNLAEAENVQIFATTHSYECIVAAHKALAETPAYDFAVHRLDEVKGEIKVTTYDKESLETSFGSHWEVR
jgi:predicted ATPase